MTTIKKVLDLLDEKSSIDTNDPKVNMTFGRFVTLTDERMKERLKRIDEIAKYEDGWLDGDGIAVSQIAIVEAIEFLHRLQENGIGAPAIFASIDEGGGVSFQWTVPEFVIEVTIDEYGELSGFGFRVKDHYTSEFEGGTIEDALVLFSVLKVGKNEQEER